MKISNLNADAWPDSLKKKFSKTLSCLGQEFHGHTVLSLFEHQSNGVFKVRCRCFCGKEFVARLDYIKMGRKKSCGCIKNIGHTTHHMAVNGDEAPEYLAWSSMKKRVLCKTHKSYPDYGGRGIGIYPEWLASFEEFYRYVGPRPGKEYSLDRINNDGNYEPGNVRWATWNQQANNRRSGLLKISIERAKLILKNGYTTIRLSKKGNGVILYNSEGDVGYMDRRGYNMILSWLETF